MSVKKNLVDQKAYLKKYLSGDRKKKKKKDKKHKTIKATVKIIDDDFLDDADNNGIDEELLVTGEDAPQIVGEVIEHQATEPKVVKWRSIAIKDEPDDDEVKIKLEKPDDDLWGRKANAPTVKDEFSPQQRKIKVERNSVEKYEKTKDKNLRKHASDSDLSPPRHRNCAKLHNSRYDSDSDLSLPRRRRRSSATDSDMSLPRRTRKTSSNSDSDLSPRRRSTKHLSSHRQNGVRRQRQDSDSDLSPPRRRRRSKSPQSRRIISPVLLDRSPPQKRDRDSPSRRRKLDDRLQNNPFKRESNVDATPPRRQIQENSKERTSEAALINSKRQVSRAREISMSPPPTHRMKATKTLDGKRAGLQEAQALKAENEERRRAEERLFENMSKDVSGRDAEIAVRISGRKGRRAREAQEEDPEERRLREKREQEKKEVYDRWGKGLKQVEDRRMQLADEAYESSKPLARYSDDVDLDRHLREQERAEDPMLEYMRKKKREQAKEDNIPVMPKYEGTYPENRFSIAPGYRWDGVDRSNGYEKRWFDVRNEKRALEDEAYKYSVEDM